ncbi:MAG TPA: undecaprenyl-diphosphate phosphatase [Bacteroidales bacterium]|nr:undecaprenyl-diphosphate phosphatase [Bacteroidales bacterium]
MSWLEALILGIIQGLTEFLPVSSSGHLEIGKAVLGIDAEKSLMFTVAVHGATVLSTIIVFRKEIMELIAGFFRFQWNPETQYLFKIIISMLPVGLVGLFLKEELEGLFNGNVNRVGFFLLITAFLLTLSHFAKPGERKITAKNAFLVGLAQALAVLPGISRSGATISTGLMLGIKREEIAKFSFLMVLIPILGENFLEILGGEMATATIGTTALVVGSLAAFISGLLACTWMLRLVKKGKLIWFALYCALLGIIAIIL